MAKLEAQLSPHKILLKWAYILLKGQARPNIEANRLNWTWLLGPIFRWGELN